LPPFAFNSSLRSGQRVSVSFCGPAFGVGHPVKPLPDVWAAEARRAGIDRADGVRRAFQVSVYSVEPSEAETACNLFAKHSARAALADEREPFRPEITLIIERGTLARVAEGLAGTTARPDFFVVWPPGAAQGVAPDADAGEEMALPVSTEVVCSNI